VENAGYNLLMTLAHVKFYGFPKDPQKITVNGISQQFVFDSINRVSFR